MDFSSHWKAEKSFWLDGPHFYETHMMADARMVFPEPVGILKGEEIVEGLEQAPRWQTVEISESSHTSSGNTVILAYRAVGQRDDADPYSAYCSSTYVLHDRKWKLISHQQTPL